jgi:hypothetical protein
MTGPTIPLPTREEMLAAVLPVEDLRWGRSSDGLRRVTWRFASHEDRRAFGREEARVLATP